MAWFLSHMAGDDIDQGIGMARVLRRQDFKSFQFPSNETPTLEGTPDGQHRYLVDCWRWRSPGAQQSAKHQHNSYTTAVAVTSSTSTFLDFLKPKAEKAALTEL